MKITLIWRSRAQQLPCFTLPQNANPSTSLSLTDAWTHARSTSHLQRVFFERAPAESWQRREGNNELVIDGDLTFVPSRSAFPARTAVVSYVLGALKSWCNTAINRSFQVFSENSFRKNVLVETELHLDLSIIFFFSLLVCFCETSLFGGFCFHDHIFASSHFLSPFFVLFEISIVSFPGRWG